MARGSLVVVPTGEPPPCRDENERKYLRAQAADADYLVTTDPDLLVLEKIGKTEIGRPGHLWRTLNE